MSTNPLNPNQKSSRVNNSNRNEYYPYSDSNQNYNDEQNEVNNSQFSTLSSQRRDLRGNIIDPRNKNGTGGGSNTSSNLTSTNSNGTGGGPGSMFIETAKALMAMALSLIVTGVGNNNPFFNIAKLLAGKSIVEVAKTLVEAGMTDDVVNESPLLKHEALLVDAKVSGLRGLFETWLQYWNQDAQANKQISKDSQQLATRA